MAAFEIMITGREDNPAEHPVKKALAELLQERRDTIDGVPAAVQMLKAKYEGVAVKEEEVEIKGEEE